jgi:hypothetical protein
MNFGLLETHAREKISAHPHWKAYAVACFPQKSMQVIYYQITGACCTAIYTRGPRKGTPNWKLRDRSTEREVHITPHEHQHWLHQWEERTGHCSHCEGTGKTLLSWSSETGTTYAACAACTGSGTSKASAGGTPASSPPEQLARQNLKAAEGSDNLTQANLI